MTTPSVRRLQQPRLAGLLSALSLSLPALVQPLGALAQSGSLDFPSRGVICDRVVRICYDSNGVSLPLTRRYFDQRAEQNLQRQLNGRLIPVEFRFSSGEVCDLRRQICWDDGWKKTNVSNRLSRQLFGRVGNADNQWGNNNTNQNDRASLCELSQRGRRIFKGNCDLRRRTTANGTAYSVELQDGRRYAFYTRQGELILRDGNRTWPAQYSRRGNEVVFNWSDLRLTSRRDGRQGDQQGFQPGYPKQQPLYGSPNDHRGGDHDVNPSQNPAGQLMQELLNSLFQ